MATSSAKRAIEAVAAALLVSACAILSRQNFKLKETVRLLSIGHGAKADLALEPGYSLSSFILTEEDGRPVNRFASPGAGSAVFVFYRGRSHDAQRDWEGWLSCPPEILSARSVTFVALSDDPLPQAITELVRRGASSLRAVKARGGVRFPKLPEIVEANGCGVVTREYESARAVFEKAPKPSPL